MTLFAAALKLSIEHAEYLKDHFHGDEVSAPEHCEFITNLHHDIAEENDYSLDPITAANNHKKTMNEELFSPEQISEDSPKLKWMKANTIVVRHDFDEELTRPWVVYSLSQPCLSTGFGKTDDEAFVDFATANGLKLWNE